MEHAAGWSGQAFDPRPRLCVWVGVAAPAIEWCHAAQLGAQPALGTVGPRDDTAMGSAAVRGQSTPSGWCCHHVWHVLQVLRVLL